MRRACRTLPTSCQHTRRKLPPPRTSGASRSGGWPPPAPAASRLTAASAAAAAETPAGSMAPPELPRPVPAEGRRLMGTRPGCVARRNATRRQAKAPAEDAGQADAFKGVARPLAAGDQFPAVPVDVSLECPRHCLPWRQEGQHATEGGRRATVAKASPQRGGSNSTDSGLRRAGHAWIGGPLRSCACSPTMRGPLPLPHLSWDLPTLRESPRARC